MNSSNRLMFLVMVAGGIFAAGFGLFILGTKLYDGITSRDDQVSKLKLEEQTVSTRIALLERARKQVDKWKAISLPGNATLTGARYANFLQDLLVKHKLTIKTPITSSAGRTASGGNKTGGPTISQVVFSTRTEGTLAQLEGFLKEFYTLNLPHAIREFTIEPQGKGGDVKLDINFGKIEVLTMSNVPDRDFVTAMPVQSLVQLETIAALKGLPTGMVTGISLFTPVGLLGNSKLANQVRPQREYSIMQKKNIFAGLTLANPVSGIAGTAVNKDILKTVQLTSITANYITEEALLRNRMTNKYVKLRSEGGFNHFEIRDGNDQVALKGKVLAIKPRDLVFEIEGKAYLLHIGQFVDEALKKELSADELKAHDVELTAVDQQ